MDYDGSSDDEDQSALDRRINNLGHGVPASNEKILTFGDSLTEGYHQWGMKYHPYSKQLQRRLNEYYGEKGEMIPHEEVMTTRMTSVIELGLSGEFTGSMVHRLRAVFDKSKELQLSFRGVCILGGTNDLSNEDNTPEMIFGRLRQLYNLSLGHAATQRNHIKASSDADAASASAPAPAAPAAPVSIIGDSGGGSANIPVSSPFILVCITIPESGCIYPDYVSTRSGVNRLIKQFCAEAQCVIAAAQDTTSCPRTATGPTPTAVLGETTRLLGPHVRVVCVDLETELPFFKTAPSHPPCLGPGTAGTDASAEPETRAVLVIPGDGADAAAASSSSSSDGENPSAVFRKEKNIELWDDNLHMTPKGYDMFGDIVFDHIMPFL